MKAQLIGRIARYRVFLQQGLPIPDLDGETLTCLNFDFADNANEFLENEIENDYTNVNHDDSQFGQVRLNDEDIEGLLKDLGDFEGELRLGGNNFSDQTLIRIARLLQNNCKLSGLDCRDLTQLSYIGAQEIGEALKQSRVRKLIFTNCKLGIGAKQFIYLIECIDENKGIEEYDFGELTNKGLAYLASHLEDHHIKHIGFGEDMSDPWQHATKQLFLKAARAKPFLSINVSNLDGNHIRFIGQLEILSRLHREAYRSEQDEIFRSKELDTEHPEYYDSDNFQVNAFKFSVKSYLSNVFESLLDESLFYLEQERQNVLRDEEIQKVTNEFTTKKIMEDICTSDGSILVLARYMLKKIEQQQQQQQQLQLQQQMMNQNN